MPFINFLERKYIKKVSGQKIIKNGCEIMRYLLTWGYSLKDLWRGQRCKFFTWEFLSNHRPGTLFQSPLSASKSSQHCLPSLKPTSHSVWMVWSSKMVPFRNHMAFSASALLQYSTKQEPHGVFFNLSKPINTYLISPHLLKSSNICSSDVQMERFPTYRVQLSFSNFSCSLLSALKCWLQSLLSSRQESLDRIFRSLDMVLSELCEGSRS